MQTVLIVVRSLKIGGIEKVAANLANAMAAAGHEVHLLIYKDVVELPLDRRVTLHVRDFDKLGRLTVIGLLFDAFSRIFLKPLLPKSGFFWKGFFYAPLFALFLARLERRLGKRFDRIIFRGQGSFDVLWPLKDRRAIYVVESFPWLLNPNDSRYKQAADRLYLRVLFHDKTLVSVSSGVAESLAAKCAAAGARPRQRVTIFNPCPIDELRRLADAPPSLAEPYIVHVGRLMPVKNQTLLIRAYARANLREKLVIVGKGKMEGGLRHLVAELGLHERVVFAGHTPNPYPWMKHARLFVLSSRSEGLGMVLIESLACGTPAVATDCPGGIRDVLIDEQAQFIVEPTEEALAAAMQRALATPPAIKPAWVSRFEAAEIARQFLALPVEENSAA